MNIGRIYGLTCLVTGKMYIGQTKRELDRRILGHLSSAKNGSNFLIHKAINKYGFENFYIEEFEIIECETPEDLINDLNTLEEFYIEYYNTFGKGYNMNKGGDNVTFNKEKWLASMEKLWDDPDFRAKLSRGAKKRFSSQVEREKQSKRISQYYKDHPEIKEIFSKNSKNYFNNIENRKKQSEAAKIQWANDDGKLRAGLGKAQKKAREAHKKPVIQYSKDGEFISEFSSVKDAFDQTKIHNISSCCKGKLNHRTAGGYIWKYKF